MHFTNETFVFHRSGNIIMYIYLVGNRNGISAVTEPDVWVMSCLQKCWVINLKKTEKENNVRIHNCFIIIRLDQVLLILTDTPDTHCQQQCCHLLISHPLIWVLISRAQCQKQQSYTSPLLRTNFNVCLLAVENLQFKAVLIFFFFKRTLSLRWFEEVPLKILLCRRG